MITLNGLVLGLAVTCFTAGCSGPVDDGADSVEAKPAAASMEIEAPSPNVRSPAQSAGVFIGVEHFDYEPEDLRYTVHDAVDIASSLVALGLLPVEHVRLLLSGEPNGASRNRYEEMEGDALIGAPTKANIEAALREQAALVGSEGILFIYFATHGYTDGEKNFLMAVDTMADRPDSAVSAEGILRATQGSRAPIVLILDACRIKTLSAAPGQENEVFSLPGSRSAMPKQIAEDLVHAPMSRSGYAVLFATGHDGIALPDEERRNGTFTGAILDSLRCTGASAEPRLVTLLSLVALVQQQVGRRTRDRQSAELLTAQGFRDFVVLRCGPVGEILGPEEGEEVSLTDVVLLRAHQPGFFAKAVLFAESNRVYYVQQPQVSFPAVPGRDVRITVDYGGPGGFQVYVGLSSNPDFLADKFGLPSLPDQDGRGRPVYWLGPVHVVLPLGEP